MGSSLEGFWEYVCSPLLAPGKAKVQRLQIEVFQEMSSWALVGGGGGGQERAPCFRSFVISPPQKDRFNTPDSGYEGQGSQAEAGPRLHRQASLVALTAAAVNEIRRC